MIYWLEKNGYDVSYASCFDIEEYDRKDLLTTRMFKVLLSVGHDEYWTQAMKDAYVRARNAGVNLAFFSGNELFWKIRWGGRGRGRGRGWGKNIDNSVHVPLQAGQAGLMHHNSDNDWFYRAARRKNDWFYGAARRNSSMRDTARSNSNSNSNSNGGGGRDDDDDDDDVIADGGIGKTGGESQNTTTTAAATSSSIRSEPRIVVCRKETIEAGIQHSIIVSLNPKQQQQQQQQRSSLSNYH